MADQTTPPQLEPIPQPPGKFILGNLPDVMGDSPILDLMEMAREQGPIYQLTFPGRPPLTVVSGFELVEELCDESRFDKSIGNVLEIARETVGDGLFTAYTQEPNWRKAHSILLPYFSLRAMQDYFPKMLDIAGQLVDKWERLNPDEVHGGTFTITNPGQFGAQFGMPIINQPQVAILGVGTIEKRPVVVDDAIGVRTMAYLTLGYDHRIVDGAVADQFMADVKRRLECFDDNDC